MGRYTPDLSKAQAGILQLPKGDYEFSVGEAKTFSRDSVDRQTQENKTVFGVQYNLLVSKSADDPQYEGKTVPLQLYMHSEAAFGINKRFIMAALGYPMDEEAKFNEKYGGNPEIWALDTETGELGSIWKAVTGTRVAATADIVPDKRDATRKNQQFAWRPV